MNFSWTIGLAIIGSLLLEGCEKSVTTAAPPATNPVVAPATQQVASKAEQFFKEGTDAMFQGDYAKAIDLLEKAADADKSKTSYRVHLARAFRYAGKDKEAEPAEVVSR